MALLGAVCLWSGWSCGLLALLCWRRAEKHRGAVRTALCPAPGAVKKAEARLPAWLLRMADALAGRAAGLSLTGDRQCWQRTLTLAGRPYGLDARLFGGLRLVSVTAAVLAGNLLLVLGITPVLAIGLIVGSYFVPALWLQTRARERQRQIGRDLPDFLDAVACALQAGGLGLDQAMERVVQFTKGPLHDEIDLLLQEMALGVPRREALTRLEQRTDCRELHLVVQALAQADRVGASVSGAFRIQAESVRNYRSQRAREAAARMESVLTGFSGVLGLLALLFILALLVLNVLYNPAFAGWRSML